MAILNFQKPDQVIMNHASETEGQFEFRPLEPGYGLTVAMLFVECYFLHLKVLPLLCKNRRCRA